MQPMTVCAVPMQSAPGDVRANADKIAGFMERAVGEGAHIACFPEACLTGYSSHDATQIALRADDRAIGEVRAAANELGMAVSFGYIERAESGALHVAHEVYDGTGPGTVLMYRKTHLGSRERDVFETGGDLPTSQCAGAWMGVQLCWESHIPDISTTLRARGAEVLLVPFASPVGGERRRTIWERTLVARAYDNGAYVVACNALTGNAERPGGGAAIWAPDGSVITQTYREAEEPVIARLSGELPRDNADGSMRNVSYFDHRRPELYE